MTDPIGGNHDGGVSTATFLYDVSSPWCWLAGERAHEVLSVVPVWQPVLFSDSADIDRAEVEAAAVAQGLPPVRWPEPFPFDASTAMLAATFAKQTGRAVAFSLAAMRQAFAAGRNLSVVDNMLIAAAACELHPRAMLRAIETKTVRDALTQATALAREAGVTSLPAVAVDGHVFSGPRSLEEAASLISSS
jgi:2-hydroxychromene-2-carboxylate isomerase